jgi:hypothetical protein
MDWRGSAACIIVSLGARFSCGMHHCRQRPLSTKRDSRFHGFVGFDVLSADIPAARRRQPANMQRPPQQLATARSKPAVRAQWPCAPCARRGRLTVARRAALPDGDAQGRGGRSPSPQRSALITNPLEALRTQRDPVIRSSLLRDLDNWRWDEAVEAYKVGRRA